MRLIDADALRREIDCCDFDSQTDLLTICQQIEEARTVDAVLVVRCKNCKYRDGTPGQPNIQCGNMPEDGFCSYGERRESE